MRERLNALSRSRASNWAAATRRSFMRGILGQLPVLVKESGGDDLAGRLAIGRRVQIDDRVIGQLGRLLRIGAVVILAEGNAGIQDDIFAAIERIGIDQKQGMVRSIESALANLDFLLRPSDGQAI